MKKTVLLIIFILSLIYNIDAQWYEKYCDVSDLNNLTSEEFACVWKKSHNEFLGGIITTAVGTTFIIAGTITEPQGSLMNPVSSIGIIINVVGIPLLIAGIVRTQQLKDSPHHHKNLNLGSLNISPSIGVNQFSNTYNYRMTLSLNF